MISHYKDSNRYYRQRQRDGFQHSKCEYCGRDVILNLSQITAARQVNENCQSCGAPLNLLDACF